MVYNQNKPLSRKEMKVNAEYILSYFRNLGWTKQAICGMLGNMETESTINPGRWQSGVEYPTYRSGYGLVQWTPYQNITNYLDSKNLPHNSMNGQCQRIEWERKNNQQWIATSEYPMSFSQFTKSTKEVEILADMFLKCYERPSDQNQPDRQTQARYWFNELDGTGGNTGDYQLAKFPLDIINITQGENGVYSHKGTLCIDFVGNTPKYPYYAPCDCTILNIDLTNAIVVFKSNTKVMCADGEVRSIVWDCIHDENIMFKVGTKLKQGDLMGYTGVGGTATGDHLHLNVIEGSEYKGFTYKPDPALTGNELHIYDVFAIDDTTTIVNDGGYDWKTSDYEGGSGWDGSTPVKDRLKLLHDYLILDVLNGWKY